MKGHHKAENIHRVLVVPASSRVRLQAEKEGLDKVFEDFGAEWRNAGCSMCLGMNRTSWCRVSAPSPHRTATSKDARQGLAHASRVARRRRRDRHSRHDLVARRPVNTAHWLPLQQLSVED